MRCGAAFTRAREGFFSYCCIRSVLSSSRLMGQRRGLPGGSMDRGWDVASGCMWGQNYVSNFEFIVPCGGSVFSAYVGPKSLLLRVHSMFFSPVFLGSGLLDFYLFCSFFPYLRGAGWVNLEKVGRYLLGGDECDGFLQSPGAPSMEVWGRGCGCLASSMSFDLLRALLDIPFYEVLTLRR
ncbi:hypothetical protein FPV67DRAFT_1150256 [Lyophyllum atratum]|nr:hypothetical protein FPV67DRAFT_1150256 [Lyophyllum atratum]